MRERLTILVFSLMYLIFCIKAADYIDQLQRESELTKYKIEKIRQEVNRLNEEIK